MASDGASRFRRNIGSARLRVQIGRTRFDRSGSAPAMVRATASLTCEICEHRRRHVIRSRCAVPLQPVDYESAVAALRVAILYLKTVYFTLARSERGEALSRDHVQRMPTPADAVRWGKTGEGRPTIIRKTGFMRSRLAMIDAPDTTATMKISWMTMPKHRLRRPFISEPKATSPVTARYATFAIGRGQEQPRPRRETVSVLTGERQSRSIGPFWVRLARHCPDSRFDRFVSSSRRRRDDRAYLQNHETPAPDAQHACDRRVGNASVDVGNLCDSASCILPNLLIPSIRAVGFRTINAAQNSQRQTGSQR